MIALFIETLSLSLVRADIPHKFWIIISGFAISLLLAVAASKFWISSFKYDKTKVSNEEKRKRFILENLYIYVSIACFIPLGFYFILSKSIDKRIKNSVWLEMVMLIIWISYIVMTVK